MNWTQIDAELTLLLDDTTTAEGQQLTYSVAARLEAFNRAQDYFALTHTAPLKIYALAIANHRGTLPSDLVQVAAIKSDDTLLSPSILVPGESAPADGYLQLDATALHFFDSSLESVELWYYGSYASMVEPVEASDPECSLPRWAQWPVVNLALAYITFPQQVSQATFRQFQSRREAGDPTDNPMRNQANWFMDVYLNALQGHKPQDREQR
jgi:hypothetical protein